ncbi:MAG TPA: ATP-dependent DNA ligase [Ktedonobacteraceae bacterium]|nr:ATP-dependent DNA ligase [Ktedonobacteraceae bacterium]
MEFARLAHTFEELERTSSRLALIELLTAPFRSVERPEEIEKVCYLVQGRVAPFFEALEMGMAEKTVARSIAIAAHTTSEDVLQRYATLGDMGLVAEQLRKGAGAMSHALSVDEVFLALRAIAQTSGKGAVEQKIAGLADLLTQVDGVSAKYVVRILLGNLRLGIGDATVLDALAKARWNDVKKRKLLEGAYNKTSDLGLIGRTIFEHSDEEEAQRAVAALDIQVGKPVHSQLAERLPSAEAIIAKMGAVVAQYKYDGLRAQIHKDGQQVTIFSRNLEDQSHMFPELIVATLKQVRAERAILDAEALAYNATSEEFLPFQETTRRRRKHGIEALAEQLPLKAFVFDILYKDGASLLDTPLAERLKILEEILHPVDDTLMLTASHTEQDAHTLTLLFDEAVSLGLEGLVVKKPESRYEAGARNFNWVKLKRHSAGALGDTIDCVLLGYLYGRGKRAALGAGSLLVGVYDPERDLFVTVTKIGTGLSDEQWRSIRERTRGMEVDHRPARVSSLIEPSVWVEPQLVLEVLADEITRSPTHTAGKVGAEPGYALRFPRLVSFREGDKKPEDATTVQELIELYQSQGRK